MNVTKLVKYFLMTMAIAMNVKVVENKETICIL